MSVDFDELELRLMREFLEQASATEWLVAALTMNYDGKAELISWMAAHPRLDRATAVALYWYSQPGYYQKYRTADEVPSVNRPGWAVVHTLQDRVSAGSVVAAGASFDPSNDLSTPTGNPRRPGEDWTAEALTEVDDSAWLVPPVMYAAVSGVEGDLDVRAFAETHGWDEGMPPAVLDVLEAAWQAEESSDD